MYDLRVYCVSVFLFVCACTDKEEPQEEAKVVEVCKVDFKNMVQTIHLIGTIKAKRTSLLIARTDGILEDVQPAGQVLPKGDLIAKLENADLNKNYDLANNALTIAHDQYQRASSLFQSNNISKQALEEKRNQWLLAQQALTNSKIELDKTRFTAPFDGVVGVFKFREGSQVRTGDPIVNFYDPKDLIVEFDIPGPVLEKVQHHPKVFIKGQEYPLTHVQKMIDPDTHMSPAFLEYPGSQGVIGANIDVDLVVEERSHVLVIPFEAVFLRDGKNFVYKVKDNKAEIVAVQLGIQEKEQVEVMEGVIQGDLIIIRGQERLYPDIAVKIYEPSSKVDPAS